MVPIPPEHSDYAEHSLSRMIFVNRQNIHGTKAVKIGEASMNCFEDCLIGLAKSKKRILKSSAIVCRIAPAIMCGISLIAISPVQAQQNPASVYHSIVLNPSEGMKELTVNGIGAGKAVGYGTGVGPMHALMWTADTYRAIDMHIPNCNDTRINGACGKTQVGQASGPATNGDTHAVLWRGTPQSAVDLNPAGVSFSVALGCGGSQQVGVAHSGEPLEVAVYWTGTADSAVNLHPSGFLASRALATDGRKQVGSGLAAVRVTHALLWSGTAKSMIDLHPAGWENSYATGIDGKAQVGYADTMGKSGHAMLWFSTAKNVIDLHPDGFERSQANGIAGNLQVGVGILDGHNHALLWQGSARSVFDLQTLLPDGYENSEAVAIDEMGNITGKAYDKTKHRWDIILWQRKGAVPVQP